MRWLFPGAATLALWVCGCDSYRGPRLSISTGGAPPATGIQRPGDAPLPPPPTVYGGRTADQWAEAMRSSNRDEVVEACRALRVLGREGRPHLLQGLEHATPETRRLCLDNLALADFKREGEAGRQRLVKLAGDRADMRIRERATIYLVQWNEAIPAP